VVRRPAANIGILTGFVVLKTLKGRTALAAALFAAIGIVLVTTLQSTLSERSVLASTEAQHESYTERVANEIDGRLRFARAALSELAGSIPGAYLSDPATLRYYLSSQIGIQQNFQSIAIFGMDGYMIASRPVMNAYSVANQEWFRKTLSGNGTPVIHRPVKSTLNGEAVVPVSYPIHDEMGRLRAVAVGTLPLNHEQLLAAAESLGVSKSAHFILITDDQSIVAHPEPGFTTMHLSELGTATESLRLALKRPEESSLGFDHRGARSLFSFHRVSASDWTLVGVLNNEQAYDSLARLSQQMLLAGGVLTLLFIPAMWFVVSRMLRPLDVLREDMRKLGLGEEVDLRSATSNATVELQQVAEEFVRMAQTRAQARAALQREKERAEVTLASIGDAVIATDRHGRIAAMNKAAEDLTGWNLADALDRRFGDVLVLFDEYTGQLLADVAQRAIHEGSTVQAPNATLRTRSGAFVAIDNAASPIHTADGQIDGAVVVLRNVVVERAAARELKWQANHDAMTGLVNRASYERTIRQLFDSLRDDEHHALLMMDLDQFKVVNDTGGHAAGDALLKQLGQMFKDRSRKTDLVVRLGGDEFAVLMYDCSAEQALRHAEELRRMVNEWRFRWNGKAYRIGLSVGIVEIDNSFADSEEAQKAADMACYMAKRTGGNRIRVHSANDQQYEAMRSELDAVTLIQSAIEQNRLKLYAQAITPLNADGAGHHFEVLVRMVDEAGAVIAPAAFIPAAERYGFMDQIDRWVISAAARACAVRFGPQDWDNLDTVCINLSAVTLRNPEIGKYILDQLEQNGVPLRAVCIEMTESAAIENIEEVRSMMDMLRRKGLRFALDDFGVGMTSLSQLRDLPIDILKIDGSFVRSITEDSVSGSLITAIQSIAQLLGMRTVAERVEKVEEMDRLQQAGVDYLQGYLFGKPQPIEAILANPPSVARPKLHAVGNRGSSRT
jgi:diguanylate cyclase (GGDEF)-like protein/PAS domain S-box-containing protein